MEQEIKLNLDGHSIFSPSSSEMWLNCAGSLLANMKHRQTEGDQSSEPAAEGTVAHEMAELWLTTGRKPIERIGDIVTVGKYDIEVTSEMLSYVAEYVAWCNELEGDKFVEVKVDFSHLTPVPDQRGTSDHVCCTDGKLTITDLKYGMGVKVYAENNTQLQIYALGALNEFDLLYDFKEVEIRVCQPRLNHFDTWTVSREQLMAFAERVKAGAKAAWDTNAKRSPSSEACLWCKVRPTCPAKAAEIEAMVDEMFADDDVEGVIERLDNDTFIPEIPQVAELTLAHCEKIFRRSKALKQFLQDVELRLFDFALKGGKLEHYKLAEGRTTRKWVDEVETAEFVAGLGFQEDDFNPRSLLSSAQMEKLLRSAGLSSEQLNALIQDRVGKPTLVEATSKRKEWQPDSGVSWDDG